MNIEVFTICDAAADYQGRLNIMGIFDTIFAAKLPAIHPYCSVALRLRFSQIEQGEHTLRLHIMDEDGNLLVKQLDGKFNVGLPSGVQYATVNLVLNLGQLKFDKLGEYSIVLAIDGQETASLPFLVREPPQAKPGG